MGITAAPAKDNVPDKDRNATLKPWENNVPVHLNGERRRSKGFMSGVLRFHDPIICIQLSGFHRSEQATELSRTAKFQKHHMIPNSRSS